jgi:hypothetical protein
MTTAAHNTVETAGYRLHPGWLAHVWFRVAVVIGWLIGAGGLWLDSVTGPFNGWLFVPGGLLCVSSAGVLLWGYRHVLFHSSTGLDERETHLRARVYQAALAIIVVFTFLAWGWIYMSANQNNGWNLKEAAYLLPLGLMLAPGAAAALVLPTDEP